MWKWVGRACVVVGTVVVFAELLNRWVSRSQPRLDARPLGIVVLGYPTRRDGSPHPIQRARVGAAVRVARACDADVLVMSGGAVGRPVPEAETMAALATAAGIDPARIRVETMSRSTWENVQESASFVADCHAVIVVSEPMHAARARRYWRRQFPDDADRVFAVSYRRSFDGCWTAIPTVPYELYVALRDRTRGAETVRR